MRGLGVSPPQLIQSSRSQAGLCVYSFVTLVNAILRDGELDTRLIISLDLAGRFHSATRYPLPMALKGSTQTTLHCSSRELFSSTASTAHDRPALRVDGYLCVF
jgi:hypothetical protein